MHQFAGEGHERAGLQWAQFEDEGVEPGGDSGRVCCVHGKIYPFTFQKIAG